MRATLILLLFLSVESSRVRDESFGIVVGLGQTVDGFTSEVEVVAVNAPDRSCSLPDFPYGVSGALGFNYKLLFCGGQNNTDHTSECYTLNEEGLWTSFPGMHEKRAYGASIMGYASGGFSGSNSLASVEYLDKNFWIEEALPDLPARLHSHCALSFLQYVAIIGGIQEGQPSNKTHFFDLNYWAWVEGPELNVPRVGANCGGWLSLDSTIQMFVAGGYNDDGYLNSTEFIEYERLFNLKDHDWSWTYGPDLPEPMCCAGQVVDFPPQLYLVGGSTPGGGFLDTIYSITSVESGWVKHEAKLKTARSFPAASIMDPIACEHQ